MVRHHHELAERVAVAVKVTQHLDHLLRGGRVGEAAAPESFVEPVFELRPEVGFKVMPLLQRQHLHVVRRGEPARPEPAFAFRLPFPQFFPGQGIREPPGDEIRRATLAPVRELAAEFGGLGIRIERLEEHRKEGCARIPCRLKSECARQCGADNLSARFFRISRGIRTITAGRNCIRCNFFRGAACGSHLDRSIFGEARRRARRRKP
jgi:hypothetical protein